MELWGSMEQGKQPFSSALVVWNLTKERFYIIRKRFHLTKWLLFLQNLTYMNTLPQGNSTLFTAASDVYKRQPSENYVFDIDKKLLIKQLSTGMRRKVYYNALLQKPYTLYIFDEPFNGLDISSSLHIKQLLRSLAQTHIVWVASHLLETLQDCECIYLLQNANFQRFTPKDINTIEQLLMVND